MIGGEGALSASVPEPATGAADRVCGGDFRWSRLPADSPKLSRLASSAEVISMTRSLVWAAIITLMTTPFLGVAAEPSAIPKPVPATRAELKRALEALKSRQPRLPLDSSLTGSAGTGLLPDTWGGGGGLGTGNKSESGLESRLLDCCFWVVSRGNNCHYCLGHQELKLQYLGLDDDTIAARQRLEGLQSTRTGRDEVCAPTDARAKVGRRWGHCGVAKTVFRSGDHRTSFHDSPI